MGRLMEGDAIGIGAGQSAWAVFNNNDDGAAVTNPEGACVSAAGGPRAREAQAGITAAAAGTGPEVLRPLIWWPGLALPRASQAPVAAPCPWLLLVDRRDPRVLAASADLEVLLQPEERARRDRFRFVADRHRALLGRGVLRLALGAWLGRDPAALAFQLGPHGKPALARQGLEPLQFNVAHSGDLILLAFHSTSPVGVDVEQHRPDLAWEPLARRVLSPAECQQLERLPPDQRREAFLAAWCRLEARLKARGEGLVGLERLQAEALAGHASPGEQTWAVELPSGYAAAAAVATAV
jgi:4'-phosphopantetheinyl transferase